jgi:CDP-glucose 4,6-dehydratase
MRQFKDIYRRRRVLVTGHTGFKGSWLSLWLQEMGAEVSGIALPPEEISSHWSSLGLGIDHNCLDIRQGAELSKALDKLQPEIIFHLAAQPLVRRSYQNPAETWTTNVVGTANILDACRTTKSVRAIIVVTSDKCYENKEWAWGYRENDGLGGHDPYSASKAAAELVATSYRKSFFNESGSPLLATARAGNVIGGGDWSNDRLIPDLVRAVSKQQILEVRYPYATRPWQHVLESLSGYLSLGQNLLEGDGNYAKPWNFGPAAEGNRSVAEMLSLLNAEWPSLRWKQSTDAHLHEAQFLYLDSSMARQQLDWRPVWDFKQAVHTTAEWYKAWIERAETISRRQLADYCDSARQQGVCWASA